VNTLIFSLIKKNLEHAFALNKYERVRAAISADTVIDDLPWTPARYRKFKTAVETELSLSASFGGTVRQIVDDFSERYIHRFFAEIWKPRTNEYAHSGWQLVDEINSLGARNVLDVGCGYHPFKGRINNLVGIDPYNDCADYMVDILDYKVPAGSHDYIVALGAINFNSREDIEQRFGHCVELLAPGGRFYLRANPGIIHFAGPYVEIFPWSFEIVKEFEIKYGLKLETFKKDTNSRLYFVYSKPAV
jgi:hypothetical protein